MLFASVAYCARARTFCSMVDSDRTPTVWFAVLMLGLGCGGAQTPHAQSPAAEQAPPAADAASKPEAEHQRVKVQFADPRLQAMLGNATGKALAVGEEPMKELVQSAFVNLMDSGNFDFEASVSKAGNIEAYKQHIASYLTSSDVTARGIAALALAIVNDPKYVEPVAALLRNKDLRVHEAMLTGYDRGMAMLALALLKATQYRPEIEAYAHSSVSNDSEGAKAALELMDR
jgi:hypothetical protein